MLTSSELRDTVNKKLDSCIEKFYETVKYSDHHKNANEKSLNKDYYKRNLIETILRIRLSRIADSKLISNLTKTDPLAAKKWAEYMADEMLHDKLFLKDLEKFEPNTDRSKVYNSEPTWSTKMLQGFLYYTIDHEGPLGLLTKAYFLEYTSGKTQPEWVDNIEKIYGTEYVSGSKAHLGIDDKEDHSSFVWGTLYSQIKGESDQEKILEYVDIIFGLFASYFKELYYSTVEGKKKLSLDVLFSEG